MKLEKFYEAWLLRGALAALALTSLGNAASAASPTVVDVPTPITVSNTNVLNLLSPFLSLPGTAVGREALTDNLSSTITVNHQAAASTTIMAVSISDKSIFSSASASITLPDGTKVAYGPAANLAGGLPLQAAQSQGGVAPYQQWGGLGNLGTAYQTAVSPSGGALSSVVNLLTTAYNFTSTDLGIAKNYFANGGATNSYNATTDTITRGVAVAPAGLSLPTANGLPNTKTSVYDSFYAPTGDYTSVGSGIFGNSRPVQVSTQITVYDPTAIVGLTTNPAFPSGHTTYAWTNSLLVAMMVPEFYQSMVLRASEYANSRVSLGVHYALDVIASRAFVAYDLSQLLNATDPAYLKTNAVTNATPINLQTSFVSAAADLRNSLQAQTASCGGSLTACAASNPYDTYSLATYGSSALTSNSAIYQYRQAYGLPTLSFAAAPREQAPTGGPDASILLSTVYGGSTTAAKTLASAVGGPSVADLTTDTINQIIVNTETNAIAAFYGTSLSYWTRINLYDAAGYLNNIATGFTGSLITNAGDNIRTGVTVANGGVFGGSGKVNGDLDVKKGGAFGAIGNGTASYTGLTVTGKGTLEKGSTVQLTGIFLPGTQYTLVTAGGAVTADPDVKVDTSSNSNLMSLFKGQLTAANSKLQVELTSHFASVAETANQRAVAQAIDAAGNAGGFSANGVTFLNELISNNTAATAPATFVSLSGEGLTGQQNAALNAGNLFVTTVLGQVTFWGDDRASDIFGMKDGGSKDGPACSTKDGPCPVPSRARLWASGFGQHASIDGQASNGSANQTSSNSGVATGIDYQVTPNIVLGITGGYSDSRFTVSDRATSGTVQGGYIGGYGIAHYGDFYVAGTFDYANFDNKTDRSISGLGALQLARGKFSSDEWIGRFEAGYKYDYSGVSVTPFAGFQLATLSNDDFSETNLAGSIAGLHVNAQDIDSDRSIVGLQLSTKTSVLNGWSLTPYARASWEHEFSPDRSFTASFQALPTSQFTVYGAGAAEDLAHVNAGFKLDVTDTISAFAAFDGEFSGRGDSYAGTGGLRIRW